MIIPILQIIVSVALVTLIVLQQRGGGMSGLFGGDGGGVYQTRRGLEKIFFTGTIILAIVFVGLAVLQFLG